MSTNSLRTDLNVGEFPSTYRRFSKLIGEPAWARRTRQVKEELKGNPFLKQYLYTENEIAIALSLCGELLNRYGGIPENSFSRSLYPAFSFAAQTLSMMDLAPRAEAARLRKRVTGSFANPDDMRAIRLELSAATHFSRRGWAISWPEMMQTGETFDLLTTSTNGRQLEVECKCISNDKGRRIHRREALDFHRVLHREVAPLYKTLRTGLAVVLTVPDRLPSRIADRKELAKRVCRQIHAASSVRYSDGTTVQISEFDPTFVEAAATRKTERDLQNAIERVTDTRNCEGIVLGSHAGGAIAFVVKSALDDSLIESTFQTLGDASKRQLTGRRAGLLIAGFDGLEVDELLSIAEQDRTAGEPPTALRIGLSQFLSSQSRLHVVGVGFLSRSALNPAEPGIVSSGGAAYYFPHRESISWSDDFDHLFN